MVKNLKSLCCHNLHLKKKSGCSISPLLELCSLRLTHIADTKFYVYAGSGFLYVNHTLTFQTPATEVPFNKN